MKRFVNKGQGPIKFTLGGNVYSARRDEEFTVPDKHADLAKGMGLPIEMVGQSDDPEETTAEFVPLAEFERAMKRLAAEIQKVADGLAANEKAMAEAIVRIDALEKALAAKVDPKARGPKAPTEPSTPTPPAQPPS